MRKVLLAAATAAAFAPCAALATTGYFSHGYGIKSKAMGGVGIALPQDALAAASNPAGMAWVGNRLDLGVDWFKPDRGAEVVGSPAFSGSYDGNGTSSFLIPEFGYNRMLTPNQSLGVAVYGNGGMNTTYEASPFPRSAAAAGGRDLMQMFVAPTWQESGSIFLRVAHRATTLRARGLQPFAGFPPRGNNQRPRLHNSRNRRAHRLDGQVSTSDALATYRRDSAPVRQVQRVIRRPGVIRHSETTRRMPEDDPRTDGCSDIVRINTATPGGRQRSDCMSSAPPLAANGGGFAGRTLRSTVASCTRWKRSSRCARYVKLKQPIPASQTASTSWRRAGGDHLTWANWKTAGGSESPCLHSASRRR